MLPNLPSFRFQPRRYCPDGVREWSAYLPFAADLVDAVRPSSVVELGTQSGEFYFGLCQAIQECGIRCSAHAVDTWNGHSHGGERHSAVFEEVSAYNTAHYRSFSTLLRMRFDQASTRFADETTALLHLGGSQTHAKVQHDFETWYPKVRPGGIILVHDICVRKDDFGVWRFWEEIAARLPSFAFHHSCGLGIIAKPGGTKQTNPLLLALFGGECNPQTIRDYYVLCAERLRRTHQGDAVRAPVLQVFFPDGVEDVRRLFGTSLESRSEGTQLRQALNDAHAEVVQLRAVCDGLVESRQQVEADSTRILNEFEVFSGRLAHVEAELRDLSNDRNRLESNIEQLWGEARRSQTEIESLRMSLDAAHAERTAIQQSLSWKITSPLRRLGLLLAYRGAQQ